MIPRDLREYLDAVFYKRPEHPYTKACLESDLGREETDKAIDIILTSASVYTGMTKSELLKKLDFDKDDYHPDRIQSLFAVLRMINILTDQFGFTSIRPLPRSLRHKEADLLASYRKMRFAIEVARSNEISNRMPKNKNSTSDFFKYLNSLWEGKESQIRTSMKKHRCERGMLAVVIDSESGETDVRLSMLSQIGEKAYHDLTPKKGIHLLLTTGHYEYETPLTVVFPKLKRLKILPWEREVAQKRVFG